MKWTTRILIAMLFGVGMWLRFWHLDVVPSAFYHDEMDYVVTGESLLKWGTDLSGTWTPWQIKPLRTINFTAEWPAVFHATTQLLLGSSPASARMTNALWGLFTVILLWFLVVKLTNSERAGWWASAIMLVNPWHIHVSRLGYESTISLFFQLLFLLGLISILAARYKWYWSVITPLSMVIAYYTYHGAKFTVIILMATFGFWWLAIHRQYQARKMIIFLSLLLVGLVAHSVWINHVGGFGTRSSTDLYSVESEPTATLVDRTRRDQIPVGPSLLMTNKYVFGLSELAKRYWFVFDTNRLFVSGYEGSYQFSLLVGGYFGLIELIGWLMYFRLEKENTQYKKLLVLLLLTSPIATVIAGYQALLRSAFTYALLVLFAGCGISFLTSRRSWLTPFFLFWMSVSGIWFGWHYFSRYPLITAQNHMLSERILARYVRNTNQPITISVDLDSYIVARALVYYNQLFDRLTIAERRQFAYPFPATFHLGNVTVTTECPTSLTNDLLVVSPNKWKTCHLRGTPITSLVSPLDNGSYYFIGHNYLCGETGRPFIHLTRLSDLNVEKMSDSQFCDIWIKQ